MCYLNDIIIVTQNFDNHLKYLNLLLDKIKKENLKIVLNKCEFGSETKYFGFEVNEKGLQIDDDKIQPILEFPKPKNIKQLQPLILHFTEIIEPLNTLLEKDKKWE